jgi:hypothetical protein
VEFESEATCAMLRVHRYTDCLGAALAAAVNIGNKFHELFRIDGWLRENPWNSLHRFRLGSSDHGLAA